MNNHENCNVRYKINYKFYLENVKKLPCAVSKQKSDPFLLTQEFENFKIPKLSPFVPKFKIIISRTFQPSKAPTALFTVFGL